MTIGLLGLLNEGKSQRFATWLGEIDSLTDSVDTGAHRLSATLDESVSSPGIELLGNEAPAPAFAHLSVEAQLARAAAAGAVDLFSEVQPTALPEGNLAALDLAAELGAEASGAWVGMIIGWRYRK